MSSSSTALRRASSLSSFGPPSKAPAPLSVGDESLQSRESSAAASGRSTPAGEDEAAVEASKPPPLSQWQILCLCLPAAAVQVGWTVGESLLIPYLLSLGVSPTVANFAWLVNPLFGLFLQPLCGHLSDNCSSPLGRRRPFLFAFHLGSVCGLLTVVFAAQLLPWLGLPAYVDGRPSTGFIVLIFLGFACADMCHDLLLMPARALLNDQLPDEQTDQGNSSFALVSSLGSIIGLSMVIAPLDDLWPLKRLQIPIRATFAAAAALVMTSNVVSFLIAGRIDTPHTPSADVRQRQAKEELERMEAGMAGEGGNGSAGPSDVGPASGASSPSPSPSSKGGEELLTLSSILFVYRVVPRPLVVIWVCQFFFWYCVLHVNIWSSSYVAIDLYGAERGEEFDHGVRQATIGLLIEAVVAFLASSLMTRANAAFGVTNFYHFSALLYAASVALLYFLPSYPAFLLVMAVTGVALPAIYSSPFVLIEVHAADSDDEDDEDDEDTSHEDDAQREEVERRKQHRQLDIGEAAHPSPSRPPHRDGELSSAPALPLDDSALPTPATAVSARSLKRVSISLPSSHRPSPEASPHRLHEEDVWRPPPKETDALLPGPFSEARRASQEAAEEECDKEEDDEEDDEVYDIAFLDEWRGVLTGVYNVTMILAQIIVGLTSGLMIDWWGDIRIVFLWSASLCFAVHLTVVALKLSHPKEEAERGGGEEEEEEEAVQRGGGAAAFSAAPTPRRPPPLSRLSTVEMPPLIDYHAFSTRALPGRLRSYVPHSAAKGRHLRQVTLHVVPANGALERAEVPVLRRSRSAPALVLLARPKGVLKGVPVFQSAGAAGAGFSNERMRLERLRERTRLFSHLPSPAVRRRRERLRPNTTRGRRPLQPIAGEDEWRREEKRREDEEVEEHLAHEAQMWFSGARAHEAAAVAHDRDLQRQGRREDEDDGSSGANSDGQTSAHAFTFDVGSPELSADAATLHIPAPPALRSSFSLGDLYDARQEAGRRAAAHIEDTVVEEEEGDEDEEEQLIRATQDHHSHPQ